MLSGAKALPKRLPVEVDSIPVMFALWESVEFHSTASSSGRIHQRPLRPTSTTPRDRSMSKGADLIGMRYSVREVTVRAENSKKNGEILQHF
jgi:hypothetical protein